MKLQWKPKKSTEAPFGVDVPDVFTQAFVIEKGQQEISGERRMGIRAVQLRSRIGHIYGRSQPLRLRTRSAMWPLRRRTTSSIHTRSVEHRVPTDLAALRAKEMSAFGAKWTSKKSAKAQGRRKQS